MVLTIAICLPNRSAGEKPPAEKGLRNCLLKKSMEKGLLSQEIEIVPPDAKRQ